MDGTIRVVTMLLIGVLLASVYTYGYRLANRSQPYPVYEDYVTQTTTTREDGTLALVPTSDTAGDEAYQRAVDQHTLASVRHDQWAYVIELVVLLLLAALVFFGLRRWSVLRGGLLLGVVLGYLSIHGTFFALDSIVIVDPLQPSSLVAMGVRFAAAVLALLVVAFLAVKGLEKGDGSL